LDAPQRDVVHDDGGARRCVALAARRRGRGSAMRDNMRDNMRENMRENMRP
jgi:hypothetical protein